jgi:hypothetical protein
MLVVALTLLATVYKPNPFTQVDGTTTIHYYTESNSATYRPQYDSASNTLTFPDDSSLSYAGKVTVEDSNPVRLFPFKLIIRIKNASASTTLGNGFGIPALAKDTFPESPVMYINVIRYRTGGPGMETTFKAPKSNYILDKFACQLYRSGVESSIGAPWTATDDDATTNIVGFVDGTDAPPANDTSTPTDSGAG